MVGGWNIFAENRFLLGRGGRFGARRYDQILSLYRFVAHNVIIARLLSAFLFRLLKGTAKIFRSMTGKKQKHSLGAATDGGQTPHMLEAAQLIKKQ